MGDDQVSGHKRPWEPGAPPEKEAPPAEGAAPSEQAGPDCSEDIAPPGEAELAELPAEARCASPRSKMRSTFNMSESSFVGAIAPTPPKSFRPVAAVTGPRNTPGSPGARVVRRVQGPFVYERRNPQLI